LGADSRAVITLALIVVAGIVAVYGMYLEWSITDLLSVLAFFGPLLTAAITYYFGQKTEERKIELRRTPPNTPPP